MAAHNIGFQVYSGFTVEAEDIGQCSVAAEYLLRIQYGVEFALEASKNSLLFGRWPRLINMQVRKKGWVEIQFTFQFEKHPTSVQLKCAGMG